MGSYIRSVLVRFFNCLTEAIALRAWCVVVVVVVVVWWLSSHTLKIVPISLRSTFDVQHTDPTDADAFRGPRPTTQDCYEVFYSAS